MQDVVKDLGFLTLGTRFKRIGELLQAQTQALLAQGELHLPAAHFPLLAALDRLGPLAVSELSEAVGVSQPVVSRSLLGLQAAGLVESEGLPGDRRVRQIRLSQQGQQLVQGAKQQLWPAIEAAVAEACQALQGPLLEQLAALEAALAHKPLPQRAAEARSRSIKPARRRAA
ncbi:MarR family transcriptional regulator [Paucibacter sp. APW11]|uniref:MarR family transcriptional regulator n=1 Tax=Roseateles aquae TaxID=3077235 RepID=A0ABU3PFL8_9BURK|nr:MarR family transcriptional regulator [Paucibacter sp. APW11]MDT9001358.1 MarR family transcriptional regulator [Paucibacter sp. APW11]